MAAENLAIDREPAVGVIGAGHAGMAWARTALRAGRQVVIANSHGPDSLRSTVAALGEGALAGTVDDAVACAIVVLAVPWAAVASAVSGVDWEGRTVVDGTVLNIGGLKRGSARTSRAGLRRAGYARRSSSTGMVRTPAVWRAYSAKPG